MLIRIFLCTLLVCSAAEAATPQKSAADQKAAEEFARNGKAAFKAGNCEKAAELYLSAYRITKSEGTLYNVARSQEACKRDDEAIATFKLYIELVRDHDKDGGVADAEKHVREITRRRAAQTVAAPPIIAAAIPADPTPTTSVVVMPQPIALAKEPTPVSLPMDLTPPTENPTISREFPYWRVGVAGAALAIALGLYVSAHVEVSNANATLPVHNDEELAAYNTSTRHAEILRGGSIAATIIGTGLGTWALIDYFK